VPAGYLGLWPAVVDDDQGPGGGDGDDGGAAGPAAEPDPDPQIRVVGRFPKGAEGTGTESIPVSAFPPADLFGAADPDGGRLVLVVPVRTEAQDWGVLAMVDRNRSFTPPGRELINNAASLLSVALDHDAVLRSLKRQQQRLHHAALFDPLTGLPNRTLLLDRLRQSAHRAARRPDRQFALLFLDLNGFKNINDTLGHAAGDQLLVEVAHRLTRILRRTDTAARMGGDEFVVLLDGLHNPDEATLTAERVRARVTEPMVIDGRSVGVGVSIGVSRSDEGSLDVDELLRRADSAMYRAKLQSRRDAASSQ
jgi:diguanylate cyclase (GGDEF)-like protein